MAHPVDTAQRGEPSVLERFTRFRNPVRVRPAWLTRLRWPEEAAMPLLDEDVYRSTFGKKMLRVDAGGNAPFPFWSYVDQIPKEDYRGFDCSEGSVRWVWREDGGRFEHILIDAKEDKDVFMVIVLDLQKKQVVGHRLMDFKQQYGLRQS